ncbi:MAG: hypothetical protein IV097_12175 [Burkholderiaceae bacterium]|nr:hypothetical protein [Burkholderiaceae bacterium]
MDKATALAAPVSEMKKRLTELKEGPATYPVGREGIPSEQFAAEIDAAHKKWAAMLHAQDDMEEASPRTGPQEQTLQRVIAWKDYWDSIENALTKAQTDGLTGFDPAWIEAPAELPDFSAFAEHTKLAEKHKAISEMKGRDSVYARCAVPPPAIRATDFGPQLAAARQKKTTLQAVRHDLESIDAPSDAQQGALRAAIAWEAYWGEVERGLEKAQQESAPGFDPASIPQPKELPDFKALAGGDKVTEAYGRIAAMTGPASPLVPVAGTVIATDEQIKAADDKWAAMLNLRDELRSIGEPSAAQKLALAAVEAWEDYWYTVWSRLSDAKKEGIEFDLASVPPPVAKLPGDALACLQIAAAPDQASLLAPATVPAPRIEQSAYDLQIKAADAKWAAMLAAQSMLKAVAEPNDSQTQALELVNAWEDYWYKLKRGLTQAQEQGLPEFDAGTLKAPARQPDLAGLDAAAQAPVVKARQLRDAHRDKAVTPIEKEMARCLPLLDAPQNNPERLEVGGALQGIEAIDERIKEAGGILSPQLSAAKAGALADLERTLFAWNDRRARQHLPPSAEAVAMADMLQAEHLKLIKQVVKDKLPLTVSDADQLDPEEEIALQKTWSALCDGSGNIKIPTDCKPSSTKPTDNRTPQEAEQFRAETLANFARLLGSASGRHLVAQLNSLGKELRFEPSDEAACLAGDYDASSMQPPVTSEGSDSPGKPMTRSGGSGSTVFMQRGAKDSDVALRTKQGGQIHSPRFIAMGHEMVHALHNARGSNRRGLKLEVDPIWSNMEEFQTINKGKTSEQTLRAQYGLSAERFGHDSTDAGAEVAQGFSQALDTLTELGQSDQEELGRRLTLLGRDPDLLSDATKQAILKAPRAPTGSLPTGWDANLLSIAQMELIIAKRLPPELKRLGWSPFDLAATGPGDSIEEVVTTHRHHPRSPQGLRYASLGGDKALEALAEFQRSVGVKVAAWKDLDWPSKLEALSTAQSWVSAFGLAKGGDFARIAGDKGKLTSRLPQLAEACKKATVNPTTDDAVASAASFATRGGLAAINGIRQLNLVLGTRLPEGGDDLAAKNLALDKASGWLLALAGEIDPFDIRTVDPLNVTIHSSVGGGGPLHRVLTDVVMAMRRGRAVDPGYLSAAVEKANKLL